LTALLAPSTAAWPANLVARVQGHPTPAGDMDLDVHTGEVVLLRGPNGSGKTSLLRALAGLPAAIRPREAKVIGSDPVLLSAAALQAHLVQQDPRDGLVGLTVAGEFRLRRAAVPSACAVLADRPVATLSSGETRRVALHSIDAARPLLLLDEPMEGLDAAGRALLVALVRAHATWGAVIATDHTNLLREAVTRVIDLAPNAPRAVPSVQLPTGGHHLAVPSTRIPFLRHPLPALRLGPGLHAIVGPNGGGKSTLLRAIAGLLPGCDARIDGARVDAGSNLRLLLPHARDMFRQETVTAELPDSEAARQWGLASLSGRHPLSLSGGQGQRLALAKALAPAAVHLLDEPEAHLDADARAILLGRIAERCRQGACILAATHDQDLVAMAATRTFVGGS
jgi:energy-coupling factor transporter ATP-binding protein EcfA2